MEKISDKTVLKIRCYKFSVQIVKFIGALKISNTYSPLINQLLRSATSVGANVVEAKSASSKRDFIKYYEIALKSSNETKYWLCLLRDGLNIEKKIKELLTEIGEISNMIASSVIKLKEKEEKNHS
ncbi:MAG: four helix bundle protein [Ignavibacteria bacterium CG22_combo_CG10-13_8_21_14_all_37_15]|nr:four helix bundle protein [Ignavibacteria bacterium]OIO16968.1 MAG: hypothetical protein AUJ54_10555 [Ignavibacteria bacterium CG1_02_37_35]PIP77960.1 MAG: four helix bundle protein [Ignavibacteria bacterium CG22_combo_CG10-13_8_21_14_all_37_15]PIS43742.1 MAG: four helix bundle protein [Ignavibacteria bacterium CG08_land_8_20_14_0_20_37_9]PIX95098.1 MAG: four helix bundle protein [Ignavibacteria bacterium CG_4_10_14_3_um_filter_37_18]PJC61105.1 MAG: four helix bundle protein [Ignavibacteria